MTNKTASKIIFLTPLMVLLIPFIGMIFTKEVNWGPGDFIIGYLLLSALVTGIVLSLKNIKTRRFKVLAILATCITFLLIWAELAVGII